MRSYFTIFYKYVGNKLFVFLTTAFAVGLLDGLGISMLLPLLTHETGGHTPPNAYTDVVVRTVESLGLPASFNVLLLLIVGIFLFKALFRFVQVALNAHISSHLLQQLRFDLIERLSRVDYVSFLKTNVGYLNNIVSRETEGTINGFKRYIALLIAVLNVIVYVSFAVLLNWQLTLLAVLSGGVIFFSFRGITEKVRKLSVEVVKKNAQIQQLFIPFIYNFKYLKATASFAALVRQLTRQIRAHRHFLFRSQVLNAFTASSLEPLAILVFAGFIYYLVNVSHQQLTAILIPLLFLYRSLVQVFAVQKNYQVFLSTTGSVKVLEDVRKMLDASRERDAGRVVERFQDAIAVDRVGFSFDARKVLSEITLRIPCRSSVAIVGESGSGKTTLLDILSGLLQPSSGSVTLDGVPYDQLNKESLRSLFCYITQEPVLFNDTIENNISLWTAKDAHAHELEQAATLAHCRDFIRETAEGFSSSVGDHGVRLSGGQRQRLAIAREIYRDRPIMVFDEATSSLDSESESYIQQSIAALAGQKTIIMVAHRISTIRMCDYIYVLKEGCIIEEGTWEQLTADDASAFAAMCRRQGVGA